MCEAPGNAVNGRRRVARRGIIESYGTFGCIATDSCDNGEGSNCINIMLNGRD